MDAQFACHSNQIRKCTRRHFPHDLTPVDLQCNLSDTEHRRRWFI
jgi:hypothetical protein